MAEGDSMREVLERPVSRRAKDEASLSRLAAIVDNSPDAILGIDLGGTVTDWNRGAERLYGYSAEEMIGGSISALVPRDAAGELEKILETVRRGEVVGPYDTVRLHRGGTPCTCRSRPLPSRTCRDRWSWRWEGTTCRSPAAGRPQSSWPPPTVRTWSCWTSACLEWTATRRRAACVSRRAGRDDDHRRDRVRPGRDRERTRAAGFDRHLVKPVDLDALRRFLREVPSTANR